MSRKGKGLHPMLAFPPQGAGAPGGGGGGGGGAPDDAQYIALATNATLTDERVITAGTNIVFVDGGAGSTLTINVPDASETVKGAVELATSAETTAGLAIQANDTRLSDDRDPTAHGTTHNADGTDPLNDATETVGGIVELATSAETTAGLAVQASDTRLSDSRAPNGAAGGDLTGTYPNPTIGTDKVTYAKIQNVSATDRILGRDTAGAGDIEELTVTGGVEFTGTGIRTSAFTGDATKTAGGTALTIANNAVTYAKMQDVTATNRFIGRITSGAGDPEELTGTQATTLLDVFTDLLQGVVPASGGGTTNYLRADGTWNAPPGAGGGAPTDAQYLTLSTNGTLSDERVLTAGTNIAFVDGGAGSTLTVNVPDASTTVKGAVELATSAETTAGLAVQASDTRLSDSRAPNGAAGGDLTGTYPNPTVGTDKITYAKMQNISATDRLLGRDTALAGDPEELTVGGGIEFTGSGGIQSSAYTGDVTKTAGGTALTIANNTVTYAKMQDISATDRLLGRDTAGAGDTEELTVGGGVEFTGSGGIQSSAYTGDVTKTAGGTATTIANDAVTNAKAANMAANTIKGNDTAGSTDPTDIAVGTNTVLGRVAGNIVAATLVTNQVTNDAITYAKIQNVSATDRLLGRDTALAGDAEELTVGGGIEFTGSGGIQSSAYTGDVTKIAGGTATTIANDAVTYAKMQNVSAASKLLGRGDSGSGDPQEITLGSGLTMTGTTLSSSGGSGAPTDAQYLTLATNATLTVERVLTAGTNISFVDAGAGSTLTVNVPNGSETTKGAVELATDGENAANVVVQGNDSRLVNLIERVKNRIELYDDFFNSPSSGSIPFLSVVSGTGAAVSNITTASLPGVFGLIGISTGTTTTGFATVSTQNNVFYLGQGEAIFEAQIILPALSVVAQEFIIRFGFMDRGGNGTDIINGVYFEYDRLSSVNWRICGSQGSTRSKTNSSNAVVINTTQKFKIVVNADCTSAEFFINNISIGTQTGNLPSTNTQVTGTGFQIVKSAGTLARLVHVDYIALLINLTTPR